MLSVLYHSIPKSIGFIYHIPYLLNNHHTNHSPDESHPPNLKRSLEAMAVFITIMNVTISLSLLLLSCVSFHPSDDDDDDDDHVQLFVCLILVAFLMIR